MIIRLSCMNVICFLSDFLQHTSHNLRRYKIQHTTSTSCVHWLCHYLNIFRLICVSKTQDVLHQPTRHLHTLPEHSSLRLAVEGHHRSLESSTVSSILYVFPESNQPIRNCAGTKCYSKTIRRGGGGGFYSALFQLISWLVGPVHCEHRVFETLALYLEKIIMRFLI